MPKKNAPSATMKETTKGKKKAASTGKKDTKVARKEKDMPKELPEDDDFIEEKKGRSRKPSRKVMEAASPAKKQPAKKRPVKSGSKPVEKDDDVPPPLIDDSDDSEDENEESILTEEQPLAKQPPAKRGRGRPKNSEKSAEFDEKVRAAAKGEKMSVAQYYNYLADMYKASDLVMINKNDLRVTEYARGLGTGYAQSFADNIRDYGWEQDSVLMVMDAPKEDCERENNPNLKDVHDGNTRTLAVRLLDSITHVPCRIITLPPGVTKIPELHALSLAKHKNNKLARVESFIDFIISMRTALKADKAKEAQGIKDPMFLRYIVHKNHVDWNQLKLVLNYQDPTENRIRTAYRVLGRLTDEEIDLLKELNSKMFYGQEDIWPISKTQAPHFLSADPDIRREAILANDAGEIKSERDMTSFCVKRMLDRYIDRIIELKKIPKALVTVDVYEQMREYYTKETATMDDNKRLVYLTAKLTEVLEPPEDSKKDTAIKESKKKARSKTEKEEEEQVDDTEVVGDPEYKKQNMYKWGSAMFGVLNTLAECVARLPVNDVYLRHWISNNGFEYIMFQPRQHSAATFSAGLFPNSFAESMKNNQTLIILLESLEHTAKTLAAFAKTKLIKVAEFTFFSKKIKQTTQEAKPIGHCYFALVFRTENNLLHYTPDELPASGRGNLHLGTAIPIASSDTKLAIVGKKVLHPTQLPLSLYEAVYLLLIPRGTRVLDISCNVGGGAASAVQHGCLWIGIEEDTPMRDNIPTYATTALMGVARELEYFKDFAKNKDVHNDASFFQELMYHTLSTEQIDDVQKRGLAALMDLPEGKFRTDTTFYPIFKRLALVPRLNPTTNPPPKPTPTAKKPKPNARSSFADSSSSEKEDDSDSGDESENNDAENSSNTNMELQDNTLAVRSSPPPSPVVSPPASPSISTGTTPSNTPSTPASTDRVKRNRKDSNKESEDEEEINTTKGAKRKATDSPPTNPPKFHREDDDFPPSGPGGESKSKGKGKSNSPAQEKGKKTSPPKIMQEMPMQQNRKRTIPDDISPPFRRGNDFEDIENIPDSQSPTQHEPPPYYDVDNDFSFEEESPSTPHKSGSSASRSTFIGVPPVSPIYKIPFSPYTPPASSYKSPKLYR